MIHHTAEVITATTAKQSGTATPFVVTGLNLSHIMTETSVSGETPRPYQALGIDTIRVKA